MAERKGFDLAAVLKGVPDLDTGEEQIVRLPLELLDPDPDNFYSLDGLDELAGNIETVGLLDPIRVRPNGERYTVVSGHRRRAACLLIRDGGNPMFDSGVSCIVEYGEASDAMRRLRLIYANSATRQLTSAEQSKQAEEVTRLLYELKEQGMEFSGRMRDHVAQACNLTKSKIGRLHAIRSNAEKSVLAAYDAGEINESVAYEFSKIPIFAQQQFMKERERACLRLDVLTAEEVREYYDLYCKLRDLRCKAAGCNCPWSGERILEALRQMNGHHGDGDEGKPFGYGNCTKGKCCLGCKELLNCPAVRCRYTEPEVKEREAAREEKIEAASRAQEQKQELFDRARQQAAETNAAIWARFRKAAECNGVDLDEALKEFCDGRESWYECLRYAKGLQPDYNNYALDFLADELEALADALHCSTDFLLGRTETPRPEEKSGEAAVEPEPRWIPGAPEGLGRYLCLLRGNADPPTERSKEFTVEVREDGPYLFERPMIRGYIITAYWPLPDKEGK